MITYEYDKLQKCNYAIHYQTDYSELNKKYRRFFKKSGKAFFWDNVWEFFCTAYHIKRK